jgi:hypothetical protein
MRGPPFSFDQRSMKLNAEPLPEIPTLHSREIIY